MKGWICAAFGAIGAAITSLLGGWDSAMITLLIFMGIDYLTGIIVAGVFHKSGKSENGSLKSTAGFKGLCKKGMILLYVLIAVRLDIVLNIDYIRNAVIICFILNELISITENAGLMGVPLPKVIVKAIDILQKKAEVIPDESKN